MHVVAILLGVGGRPGGGGSMVGGGGSSVGGGGGGGHRLEGGGGHRLEGGGGHRFEGGGGSSVGGGSESRDLHPHIPEQGFSLTWLPAYISHLWSTHVLTCGNQRS